MKLPTDIKAMLTSALPLVISIILFVVVGNLGISKISDLRTQIDQAQANKNVLTQKVNLLQKEAANVAGSSSAAAIALPDSNTVLAVITQLKNLAVTSGVALTGLKAGTEIKDPSGLSRVDVSFEIDGSRDQALTFLKNISTLAPIMIVGSIKLSEVGGTSKVSTTVKSYWAALPTSIPSPDQPVSDLTTDEQSTLNSISNLTPPLFSVLQPSQNAGRPNPFVTP